MALDAPSTRHTGRSPWLTLWERHWVYGQEGSDLAGEAPSCWLFPPFSLLPRCTRTLPREACCLCLLLSPLLYLVVVVADQTQASLPSLGECRDPDTAFLLYLAPPVLSTSPASGKGAIIV